MELKIVKKPCQDEYTNPVDMQYPNENWCVKSSMYREGDGGMMLWFKEIERVNPDIIYLYEIKSWKDKIVNGLNEDDWFEDIFYTVRYDMKQKITNIIGKTDEQTITELLNLFSVFNKEDLKKTYNKVSIN